MDYEGKMFGKWLVLGDAPDRLYRTKKGSIARIRYLFCECECGIKKEVRLENLRYKKSTQCVSCQGRAQRNYDLKRNYGHWTVLFNYIIKGDYLYCECKCDCGVTIFVRCIALRRGESTQCGSCQNRSRCIRVLADPEKRYGKWTILRLAPDRWCKRKNGDPQRVRYCFCECACGVKKEVNLNSLRSRKSIQCRRCASKIYPKLLNLL